MFLSNLGYEFSYVNKVKPYLHFIMWEKGKNSPRILTMADYAELKKTNKIIARKFDIDIDRQILERLGNG